MPTASRGGLGFPKFQRPFDSRARLEGVGKAAALGDSPIDRRVMRIIQLLK